MDHIKRSEFIVDALPRATYSEGEEVRLTISEYENVERISLRVWVRNRSGIMVPTRRGINLYPEELDWAISSFSKAQQAWEDISS